jgi:tellurium resistance protein TerD
MRRHPFSVNSGIARRDRFSLPVTNHFQLVCQGQTKKEQNTMAISLQKGGNVNLTKTAPGLTKLHIGLGWDARATDGAQFDLDASAFLLKNDGKVRSDADFIFYNQTKSVDGAGDDESIKVDLSKVAADVEKIAFTVTIDQFEERRQNFGQVSSAYIRVVNDADGTEIARFDLGEDASTETALNFGELYKVNGEWKFKAVGQGFAGGLKALGTGYGVNIG